MKNLMLILVLLTPILGMREVFRCDEPKGVGMWSNENHRPTADGFKGVQPLVVIEGKDMTVTWGGTKLNPGSREKVWKAAVFHRSSESVSGVALDSEPGVGAAAMLYTVDTKRGYLYMSTHKNSEVIGISTASTYVSKCAK